MRRVAAAALAGLLATGTTAAVTPDDSWRAVEGVWRVIADDERCPGGARWTYALSDTDTHLAQWTQGYLRDPITIPEMLGSPPRIQGVAPFSNSRIIARGRGMVRTRHETVRVQGDRLTADFGNLRCHATRER